MFTKSRLSRETFETTLFEWSYPEIAQRCKVRGRPYPELTDDGVMKSTPLA
jgi:tRNA (guanosine-2'-O-)-methyltransferase